MPKRTDLRKVLIIGAGPIVIGQACEFDYSGSQACKALKEEGYEIVLINSNPATIMTDPRMADRTYVEPITAEVVEKIIAKERPDAVLPTLGGQTGLNVAVFLARAGVYDRYGVEVLGASPEAISRAEDREEFRQAMLAIGLQIPESAVATSVEEGMAIGQSIGFPIILRPAFTLGGFGGSTAYNVEELEEYLAKAITISPVGQVLVEQSVLGWKEIEFEVMRDCEDNVIMITSMENIDAMGVHTGDSMVVAPSQTLTAPEYVQYTDLCRRIIRKIDVTGGGINIQFGGNPANGDIVVIEVNPRLSRSSALASKATGFPIARVATKLAIGMTLDEILNDVTGRTYTFFEPTVDYCVFKIARFTFKKFPQADPTVNTSMKSVGEAMAIGRNFREALQKGIRSLEIGRFGLGFDGRDDRVPEPRDEAELTHKLVVPNDMRHFYVKLALERGMSVEQVAELTKIDRWFIEGIREIIEIAGRLAQYQGPEGLARMPDELWWEAKGSGFSDVQLGHLLPKVLAVRLSVVNTDKGGRGRLVRDNRSRFVGAGGVGDVLPRARHGGARGLQTRLVALGASCRSRVGAGVGDGGDLPHAPSADSEQPAFPEGSGFHYDGASTEVLLNLRQRRCHCRSPVSPWFHESVPELEVFNPGTPGSRLEPSLIVCTSTESISLYPRTAASGDTGRMASRTAGRTCGAQSTTAGRRLPRSRAREPCRLRRTRSARSGGSGTGPLSVCAPRSASSASSRHAHHSFPSSSA